LKSFENFYGNLNEYCVLALLPSYLEREGSSLVYMVKEFIERTEKNESGFFLHNIFELKEKLLWLKEQKQKTLLLGVTYALLDLSELQIELDENFIVMETGGMKGKRKEMLREELHEHLCKKLGVKKIHSEYGMTELLSQAYSSGNGIFETPPWMKILIRDPYEPSLLLSENKTGAINVIDLANIHSCSFIATQDLGKNCSNERAHDLIIKHSFSYRSKFGSIVLLLLLPSLCSLSASFTCCCNGNDDDEEFIKYKLSLNKISVQNLEACEVRRRSGSVFRDINPC
jgi:hypothetical protein